MVATLSVGLVAALLLSCGCGYFVARRGAKRARVGEVVRTRPLSELTFARGKADVAPSSSRGGVDGARSTPNASFNSGTSSFNRNAEAALRRQAYLEQELGSAVVLAGVARHPPVGCGELAGDQGGIEMGPDLGAMGDASVRVAPRFIVARPPVADRTKRSSPLLDEPSVFTQKL